MAGVLGRAGWTFADQALSSLSNAALSVLVARAAGVEGYGAFAVAFTVFTFLAGVSRALVNQPYLIAFSDAPADRAADGVRGATGLAVLFGVASAAVVAPVALLVGGPAGTAVAVTVLLMPAVLVQDAWRSVFVARREPRAAAANDALWAVLLFGGLGIAVTAGVRDPVPLVLVWLGTGWVAAAAAVLRGRAAPRPAAGPRFARETSGVSRYLVAEWLTVLGAAQIALLAVGLLGSPADVGSLRAAQTLLGPLTILVVGTLGFVLPELVRRPDLPAGRLRVLAGAIGAALTLVTLGWGGALLLVPPEWGAALLGEVWPGARETLPAMTLWMVGAAVSTGPMAVLRARGRARASFAVNVLIGVLLLVLTPVGFLLGGAPGAAAGMAVANLAPAPLFWLQVERVLRGGRPAVDAVG